jgi:hypothetical protein
VIPAHHCDALHKPVSVEARETLMHLSALKAC